MDVVLNVFDVLTYLGGQALSHQVTQFTIAFVLAAIIHSKQVRKEIATQLGDVATSIDKVRVALVDDLQAQGKRLKSVEDGIQRLSTRVETLEKVTK